MSASASANCAALSLVHIADNDALSHSLTSTWRSRTCRFVLLSTMWEGALFMQSSKVSHSIYI